MQETKYYILVTGELAAYVPAEKTLYLLAPIAVRPVEFGGEGGGTHHEAPSRPRVKKEKAAPKKNAPAKFSDNEIAKMKRMKSEGSSARDIAKKFECTPSLVYYYLAR